eukprot:TRINITY_DN17796_c0_g1_i2.p1 TRINITY_DN17796_c0_g1~~TRINITY_DN17796_c0_g1_i2.p1  ORF type:complete len:1137 (+),score=261.73 TRINITY_DN17796_c0_g1_i2:4428-7838(+)
MLDRDYTTRGPSALLMQPALAAARLPSAALGVSAAAADPPWLRRGDGALAVAPAEVADGAPRGAAGGGVARVESALPVGEAVLAFAGFGELATVGLAGDALAISHTVAATVLAAENPSTACGGNLRQGGRCLLRVFAAGMAAGQLFRSTLPVQGEVAAAVSCSGCPQPGVRISPAARRLRRGVASFELAMLSGDCACELRLEAPPAAGLQNATQIFEFSVSAVAPVHWLWQPSPSLVVHRASETSWNVQAAAVLNRTVVLRLAAFDAAGAVTGLGIAQWAEPPSVAVDAARVTPSGCFACSRPLGDGHCAVSPEGDAVELEGHFSVAGECLFAAGALSGLPLLPGQDTVPVKYGLSVAVQQAAAIAFVRGPTGSDLGGLDGWADPLLAAAPEAESDLPPLHTGSGSEAFGVPAALTGSGARLAVRVLAPDGELVRGDHATVVTFRANRGVQGSANGTQTWQSTVVAKAGVAEAVFDPGAETLSCGGCAAGSVCGAGCATHAGWSVSAAAGKLGALNARAPLYFVRWAQGLRVEARAARADWTLLSPEQPLRTVPNQAFDMRMTAVDASGSPVRRADQRGSTAVVLLRDFHSVPCANSVSAEQGCRLEGNACVPAEPRPCRDAAGWDLGGAAEGVRLQGGAAELQGLRLRAGGSGVAHFSLSTTDFAQESFLFISAVVVQSPAAIVIRGADCSPKQCTLRANDTAPAAAGDPLRLRAAVVDLEGAVVEGLFGARLTLRARCLDPGAPRVYAARGPDDAEADAPADTAADSGAVPDFLTPLTASVAAGEADLGAVVFSGNCTNLTLALSCSGAHCPPPTTTAPFAVAGAGPPPGAVRPLRCKLTLRRFVEQGLNATRAAFRTFADSVAAESFNALLGGVLARAVQAVRRVALLWLCLLPDGRGSSESDRSPQGSPDGGSCLGYAEAGASARIAASRARAAGPLQGNGTGSSGNTTAQGNASDSGGAGNNDATGGTGSPSRAAVLIFAAQADFEVVLDPTTAEVPAITAAIEAAIAADLADNQTSVLLNDPAFAGVDPTDLGFLVDLAATPSPTSAPSSAQPSSPPSVGRTAAPLPPTTVRPTAGPSLDPCAADPRPPLCGTAGVPLDAPGAAPSPWSPLLTGSLGLFVALAALPQCAP